MIRNRIRDTIRFSVIPLLFKCTLQAVILIAIFVQTIYGQQVQIKSLNDSNDSKKNCQNNTDLVSLFSLEMNADTMMSNHSNRITATEPFDADSDPDTKPRQPIISPSESTPRGVDLPDPLIPNEQFVYTNYGGQLIINGISENDIDQGFLGTCYFLSALSALAKVNKAFLSQSIKDNGDGTYSFRFFEFELLNMDPWRNPRAPGSYRFNEIWVTVDNDLPTYEGEWLVYGASPNPKELWVALYEKAYAQWKGGKYAAIDGGKAIKAFSALTGDFSYGRHVAELKNGLSWDWFANKVFFYPCTVSALPNSDELGTSGRHSYSLFDAFVENGQRYVVLRNPWGWDGHIFEGDNNPNDGIIKMTFVNFQRLFHSITVRQNPFKNESSS
jgi:hypothetical protein